MLHKLGSLHSESSREPTDERVFGRWALLLWLALGVVLWLSHGCGSRSQRGRASQGQASGAMASGAMAPPGGRETGPGRPGARRGPSARGAAQTSPRRAVAQTSPRRGAALSPLPADANLVAEVRRLFDTLFCVSRTPDAPCRKLAAAIEAYRSRYLAPMRRWLATHRPSALPGTLLYPFSGGDLVSALSAFPGARRLVHLSLEHGGPPDPLRGRSPAQIREARFKLYFVADLLLAHGESFSVDLQKQEQAVLPGVLPLLLVGLRAHGGVPTGLAYLRLGADGSLTPYTRAELSAAGPRARRLYTTWKDPRYSARFSHLELRFRLPGDTTDRRVIHLSANLANPGLGRHPGVAKAIARLGPVAVMLKAASYLLWTDGFSRARALIFSSARFGISDLTAPYPDWLHKRGFALEAHGRYDCMKKPKLRGAAKPWIQLFRKAATRKIPFRWGYVDCHGQNHIVLIRRRPSAP